MRTIYLLILMLGLTTIFVGTGIAYLVALLRFTGALKDREPKYWFNIGSPSNSDPNGQAKILSLVFIPNRLPQYIFEKYKYQIYAIRICGVMSIVSFAILVTLLKLGVFVDLG
jgi:hypothetical protein